MKINRTAVIAIFVAIGFKTADKWDMARINKRVAQLPDQVDSEIVAGFADEEVKKNTKAILKAFAAEETVEVIDDSAPSKPSAKPDAEEGKSEPEKKKDAGKIAEEKVKASAKPAAASDEDEEPKPAAKKQPGKAKEEPAKDKFGNREGSQAANINAQLAKKWTPIADIAKKTGLNEARVRGHGKYLEGRKLAEYDKEKGIRLV